MFSQNASQVAAIGGASALLTNVNTVLQLTGDGTNGTQNNTFVDSSANNLAVTRVGSSTQGAFTPFSADPGKWSVSYNGSTDSVAVSADVGLGFGTGDFTIEAWVYCTSATVGRTLLDFRASGSATSQAKVALYFTTAGTFSYFVSGAARISTTAVTINMWHHVALCRMSGVTRMFVDGTQQGSNYTDTNNLSTTSDLVIGQYGVTRTTTANFWAGSISNLRVIKTGLYPASFAVSSAPLSPIANSVNVSLLICATNILADSSPAGLTVTATGTPIVQPNSPFAPNAAYSAIVNGGSVYFAGTTDYLTVANTANLNFGASNFTVEMFWYPTTIPGATAGLWAKRATGTTFSGLCPVVNAGGLGITFYGTTNGSSWDIVFSAAAACILNSWNHIAFTRNGTTWSMWINGKYAGGLTGVGGTLVSNTSPLTVNASGADGGMTGASGYFSDFRVVNGTALYTAPFTPPSAPLAVITNTQLMLKFTNAGIYDACGKTNIETLGNAMVSTAQSRMGGASLYFDGTGDALQTQISNQYMFGTGKYTIECWLRPAAVTVRQMVTALNQITADDNILLDIDTSGKIRLLTWNVLVLSSTTSLIANTWTHVAVSYDGTTIRLYINGVLDNSTTTVPTITGVWRVTIGTATGGASFPYTGYIDNFRITKGQARYTANFTPSTTGFN